MKQVINELKTRLKEAITQAFGSELRNVDPAVNQASNSKFGDFQSNVALTMSKQLGKQPRQIADEIIGKLALDGICEAPTVAGPGFINFQLKQEYLEAQVTKLHGDDRLGVPRPERARKVIVDMSSPNIAKEMHVGHLRSTIIGDSIARIYEFLGHDVLRINHVGDWGTQFGMLIAELKEKYPTALTESEALDLGDLVVFYKQAKKHFDDDPQFQDTARKEVVKLQSGDAESTSAWQMLCAQSRKSFQQIYDKLHIEKLVERGESFYNDKLEDVVQLLREKGLAVESDGAICVFLDGFLNEEGKPLPLIIKKKDGGYNYATTDLASIIYRVNQDKGDDLIYVVDAGQALHFDMVIKAARKAGFVPEQLRVEHVPFGVVQGEDGKKLKTRSGETVRLQDLIDEAIRHAREDLDARLKERGREESEEFRSKLAEAIGLGAIKYADLSLNRMTNYIFSFKKMLSLQGNTAPYMMYAYVRVLGISREGGIDFSNLSNTNLSLSDPSEQALAKQLLRLDSVLDSVVSESLPNRICEYLFDLSQTFNQFYENCPVLDAPEPHRTTRLVLCNLTARMIRVGLALLGIDVVERM